VRVERNRRPRRARDAAADRRFGRSRGRVGATLRIPEGAHR
jgi:hypothetical protein